MQFLDMIDMELRFQKSLNRQFKKLSRTKANGVLTQTTKKSGRKEYYIREPGTPKERYVRKKDMEQVYRHKLKAFADFGVARTTENIRMLQYLRENYRSCDFFAMQEAIEEKYRLTDDADVLNWLTTRCPAAQSENPKYKEELKHTTSFGLLVRSKNECQIAEWLWAAGIEFYYEKALVLYDGNHNHYTVYPDFTIVLPSGYTIYWEHKGLVNDIGYMERDAWKTSLYHRNGIYQPHNLIVTCDGPDGEFLGMEISIIVNEILREMAVGRL